jgi:hypothetical protein
MDDTTQEPMVEVSWTSTRDHWAQIPLRELLAAAEGNDDSDYVVDGQLNPAEFTGSVTGEFDALLRGHEGVGAAISRRWDEVSVIEAGAR